MFESMKVSMRLLVAFGGAALMVVAIAAVAASRMQTLARLAGTPQALQAGHEAAWLVGVMAAAAAAGGLFVAAWLMRSLSRELGAEPRELAASARRVADGDLAPVAGAATRGVMADLERMREQLVSLVAAVHARADVVAVTSTGIALASAEIGRFTESQGAELRSTAQRMQAVALSVRRSADSAQQAGTQAGQARAAVAAGREEFGRVALAMQAASDGARRIEDVAGLIDGLAAQTGILALNAAAAAARAGAAGNEFAVVAHEVRALAQRITAAAAEVKALTLVSTEQAREGDARVHSAVEAMQQIVSIVAAVAANTETIGRSSEAQGGEIARLSQALSELDARLRDSIALVASNAEAAKSLDLQSTELLRAVAAFRLPGAMLVSRTSLSPPSRTVHRAGVGAQ